ncbi:MAG: sel1 repeat family protein [Hyphomicrobiaceae bacterium]|nr:sel1 repeat family protein [Hyphomicrobiaceae bacterium]
MARIEFAARDIGQPAVHAGGADALYELGLMYCTGRDVEYDLIEAHKWFNLAALRGNLDARRYRAELSREMSRGDIAVAQRRAREWLAIH